MARHPFAGLLLVLCAFAAAGSHSDLGPLLEEARRHLGITQGLGDMLAAPSWGQGVQLARRVEGSGLHADLVLDLSAEVAAAPQGSPCQAALLQVLPPAFYADPYQLEDLSRSSRAFSFQLFGPLDLEL
jgi:hypothetical protein